MRLVSAIRHPYLSISGVVFGTVSLVHTVRAVAGWPFQIGTWTVPVWLSWIAALIAGGLSFWASRTRTALDRRSGAVAIRPHQAQPGELFCVYKVLRKSEAAPLRVGDELCIFCPDTARRCAAWMHFVAADSIWYEVAYVQTFCIDCPQAALDGGRIWEL